jgi:hypothetical protein
VKIGTEPGRAALSCTECADDLGLHQIFARFQIKSEFFCVKSDPFSVVTRVLLRSAALY